MSINTSMEQYSCVAAVFKSLGALKGVSQRTLRQLHQLCCLMNNIIGNHLADMATTLEHSHPSCPEVDSPSSVECAGRTNTVLVDP